MLLTDVCKSVFRSAQVQHGLLTFRFHETVWSVLSIIDCQINFCEAGNTLDGICVPNFTFNHLSMFSCKHEHNEIHLLKLLLYCNEITVQHRCSRQAGEGGSNLRLAKGTSSCSFLQLKKTCIDCNNLGHLAEKLTLVGSVSCRALTMRYALKTGRYGYYTSPKIGIQ